MAGVKDKSSVTIIGDLVGSRHSEDRASVHERFARAVAAANAAYDPEVPLRIGTGDEFQGIFRSLGDAIAASLRLRLALLPEVDLRQGIGRGQVLVLSEEPRVEDGPGWWAARAAVEQVEDYEGRAPLRAVRTAYVAADGEPGPDPGVVNAALMTRDQVVTSLSERSLSVLQGLLAGRQQQEIADDLGISASAVSQRVRADGLGILLAADGLTAAL